MSGIRIERLTGEAIAPVIEDLAALRISIFRAFPYLYDGDSAYEAWYLGKFASIAGATVIAAWDADKLIGAATAAPLVGEHEDFRGPFEASGYDTAAIFYLAESVLLPAYRGRGLGHAFFDHREAVAREGGFTSATFCAVVRPADHPRRPADYAPLDPFWRKRGYSPAENLNTTFAWKDLDEADDTSKPMQFWMRTL